MESCDYMKLENIRKEFPGVIALDGVSLTIKKGRIHALLGENGAGKSTLMKILSGTYTNYEGKILKEGKQVQFKNEKAALDFGISIVAQELNPIPDMTISENLFLGREPEWKKGIINRKQRKQRTIELLQFMKLDYDPDQYMRDLSVAQMQMIEILKAISRNSKVIIMDEPTSTLTNIESQILFEKIAELRAQGIAIVFISHRLEEVFEVCDDYTVLRDGKFIDTGLISEMDQDKIISKMVGRELTDIYPPLPAHSSDIILEVKGLEQGKQFRNINFQIRRGEILGFAGMMGAGRSEIARAVFGMDSRSAGEILIEGRECSIKNIRDAIQNGIAMVTEDRAAYGFAGVLSIKENVIMPNPDLFLKRGIKNSRKIKAGVGEIMERLSVKAPDMDTLVGNLSGGNQQKVVLSKWLVRGLKVLILDEPTRGIDVGAKQEIYKLMVRLAEEGFAILLISSDMPEVLSMSHRVMVIADGKVAGELSKEEATQDKIMKKIVEVGVKGED